MPKKPFRFSLFVSLIASLGGFLFGYHSCVVAGALLFVSKEFHLSSWDEGFWVSSLILGALVGSLMGGFFSDRIGRKKTLFVTTIFFLIGAFFQMTADNYFRLVVARAIAGLGVGIVSVVSPLYIAEMSTRQERGVLVSMNQLAITLGVLCAYFVGYLLAPTASWREMLGMGMIPALILFVGLFFLPETPSFLAMRGRKDLAKALLQKIHRKEKEEEIFIETENETPKELTSWKHLFEKKMLAPLFVGIMISLFQQITGINVVVYYAPKIFEMMGYQKESSAQLSAVGIGLVNVLATALSLLLVTLRGRRYLLLLGIGGMAFSLVFVSLGLLIPNAFFSSLTLVSLFTYGAFFAISLGPVVWILLSEIFPMGVRGRAMGLALFVNWVANYFVSLSFLPLVEKFGKGQTFLFYAFISFFALGFVFYKVPETKGKSFEEIQKFWRK
jgi:MFS transporter, SP family, galactose:H+ symporter